jgi:formamidopyrimidine-DNA glycosylase
MPELPEVEHSRRLWQVGQGAKVLEVIVRNGKSRVFRSVNPKELVRLLSGERFFDSEALGKQLVFRFGQRGEFWLGLHLGMTGELRVEPPKYPFLKYDHLILRQSKRSLVFSDQRQFGRVLFAQSNVAPSWWAKLPPDGVNASITNTQNSAPFCLSRGVHLCVRLCERVGDRWGPRCAPLMLRTGPGLRCAIAPGCGWQWVRARALPGGSPGDDLRPGRW